MRSIRHRVMATPRGQVEGSSTGCRCRRRSTSSYDALDLIRGIDAFLNCMPGASMLAMRTRAAAASGRRSNVIACTDPRSHVGAGGADRQHRDDVRHDVPGPEGGRADGGRGPAELAELRRRPVAAVRRRPGQRRTRPGPGRQVPVPAARPRRRRARRLLRVPVADVLELDRDPGAGRRSTRC